MARLKDLAAGTKDLFMLDPRIIQIKDGFNVRIPGPDLDAHIRQLADSIKEVGVLEPVTVFLDDGVPILTNGHCRLRAALQAISEGAEIKTIPARAEERYANEADRTLGMITRNSGKPLSALEKAAVIKRLLAFGWSEADIARKIGVSATHITNLLQLDAAPQGIRELVQGGKVSATLATQMLQENGEEKAEKILNKAVETAATGGKKKATRKHVDTPKKSLKEIHTQLVEKVGALIEAAGAGQESYTKAYRDLVNFYNNLKGD